jgi:hypothetical protein
MLGILVGLGYRELRQIDEHFMENYFIPALAEDIVLGNYVEAITADQSFNEEIPGLDVLPRQEPDSERGPASLLRLVATSSNEEQIELPTGTTERVVLQRDEVIGAIRRAMDDAVETARLDRRADNQLRAPIAHMETAERELRLALETYRAAKSDPAFDRKDLDRHFTKVKRSVEAIADELGTVA